MRKTTTKTKKVLRKSSKANVKAKAKNKVKAKASDKLKTAGKKKAKSKAVVKTKAKSKAKAKTKVAVKSKAKSSVKVKAKAKIKAGAKAKVKAMTKVKAAAVKVKKALVKKVTKPKAVKAVKKPESRTQKLALRRARKAQGPIDVRPYQSKHNEEYMNEEQLEHFRNVLLQWKEQLMAEADRTMHNMQDKPSNYPDPVDRASQEEEFSLELRARDRERKLLRKIEETLNRITEHDYGYCDECGAEIGIKRLEARPTATQCIECKTIAEIREKQIGENTQ